MDLRTRIFSSSSQKDNVFFTEIKIISSFPEVIVRKYRIYEHIINSNVSFLTLDLRIFITELILQLIHAILELRSLKTDN